ncbi:DUF1289 domain-containing protein [Brevundimonas sp. LM2]|uniref:DUF1289 domain-containing protein n=1 Tax=Brevundimonas sp. LM2 TaxID=1938605 RepID=UPI000983C9C9|nr:DUF1289 domain-containing protein [Brevundimonas sp. LM2]AQR62738.1 DUF1289 domain-containing protein [Brevundimonas sp. LM2]
MSLNAAPLPRPIATPCIQVCVIDGASGLCLGCYRTLAEIAEWSRMEAAQRTEIMSELPERRLRVDPALRGD